MVMRTDPPMPTLKSLVEFLERAEGGEIVTENFSLVIKQGKDDARKHISTGKNSLTLTMDWTNPRKAREYEVALVSR